MNLFDGPQATIARRRVAAPDRPTMTRRAFAPLFASLIIVASVEFVGQMPANADASDVPVVETRCVQGSADPHSSPAQVYKDCQAAAKLFRSMFSQASPSDQGLISTNIALFEFYEAHALDGLKGPGSGDELRANAKTLFSIVSQRDPDVKVRSHARDSLKCFYDGDQKACERAFSASSTSYAFANPSNYPILAYSPNGSTGNALCSVKPAREQASVAMGLLNAGKYDQAYALAGSAWRISGVVIWARATIGWQAMQCSSSRLSKRSAARGI